MNALLRKEIRLLLPAFAGALVLVTVPIWVLSTSNSQGLIPWLYIFGAMMMGVTSFGREVGLKTFPFILAQPLDRKRIWWTKITVLGVSTVVVIAAWWISGILRGASTMLGMDSPVGVGFIALITAALTTGGVWMTLLLRQVAAAFWLTYLVPAVLGVSVKVIGGPDWLVFTVLGLYSVAAFLLARWQFLHFQDTAWTGGVLTFGWRRAVATASDVRVPSPWRALVRKELRLHEFTLAGIAALFVLHLGAVLVRKIGGNSLGEMTRSVLESFILVWIVVPLVAGSQSVAEERQLGTLDNVLCLPVSHRAQFAIKLVFVIFLGGLLSPTLMWAAEWIASAIGAGTGSVVGNAFLFGSVVVSFLALSLLSFYASTLTRSVVQAMAAGIVVTVVFAKLADLMVQPVNDPIIGRRLWVDMAGPAVLVAIIVLAYGNFKWLLETERRWRRNAIVLAAVFVAVSGAAAAIYNRAWGLWESVVPLEDAHGPARLPRDKPVTIHTHFGSALAVILPDGRLWLDQVDYGWRTTLGGGHFAAGSNWADATLLAQETVAIRADGTLWVSEKLGAPYNLVQFGSETNWQRVLRCTQYAVVLLKREGTLWTWGPDAFATSGVVWNWHGKFWGVGTNVFKGVYPGLRTAAPERVGSDSDWARLVQGNWKFYAWKRNGEAWTWHKPEVKEGWVPVRLPALDHLQVRASSPLGNDLWICDDGTLWLHRLWVVGGRRHMPELVQVGRDSDWSAVVWGPDLVALKTDGTLWRWKALRNGDMADRNFQTPPERLGTHNDWVGLGYAMNDVAALAADGTLWGWPGQDRGASDSEEWMVPSKRPVKMVNILDAKE